MGRESCTEMTWAENGKGLQEAGVSSLDQGETVENLGRSGWKYHRRTSELLKLGGGTSCGCALSLEAPGPEQGLVLPAVLPGGNRHQLHTKALGNSEVGSAGQCPERMFSSSA